MQKPPVVMELDANNFSTRENPGTKKFSPWDSNRCLIAVAPERARKIAAKNRSSMPTGIGGSFQLANSASPLGVIDSASAPTARMHEGGGEAGAYVLVRPKTCGRVKMRPTCDDFRRKSRDNGGATASCGSSKLTTGHQQGLDERLTMMAPMFCFRCC